MRLFRIGMGAGLAAAQDPRCLPHGAIGRVTVLAGCDRHQDRVLSEAVGEPVRRPVLRGAGRTLAGIPSANAAAMLAETSHGERPARSRPAPSRYAAGASASGAAQS